MASCLRSRDFAAQLADWLVRVVDPRKRHALSALDRFRDEAPPLRPLPKHPYDTARVTIDSAASTGTSNGSVTVTPCRTTM